ncbi:MAG: hypothetical protein AUJ57_08710 [Zetaproteobacteria bacterium CG1_02_53_45]|nr:MAG: hypothetical protein AUJ57_08710 [Zetaproteobacteria bacterium CG1_02_53_45]
MMVSVRSLVLSLLLVFTIAGELQAFEIDKNYLYYRDANVPPFQKSREFFDMPDRPGFFEVTMVSDTVGPLTFRIVRVKDDLEKTLAQKRSYSVGNHEFQAHFDNPTGDDDLIVEIANSNPAAVAKVSVYVVELPKH